MVIRGNKDYYKILGINENASEVEIKKAYRRLAMEYHPDRNPGDKGAEARFKEITEAYGVLIDRTKRREYDQFKKYGFRDQHGQRGFRYSQQDIFRDIFTNPFASEIFRELGREFMKSGFRFDDKFFKRTFFGPKGFFFGGVFFGTFSPFGKTFQYGETKKSFEEIFEEAKIKQGARKSLLNTLFQSLSNKLIRTKTLSSKDIAKKELNISYTLSLTENEAEAGCEKVISYTKKGKREKLSVKIPEGTKEGTKLRLKGRGLKGREGAMDGDLYLHIKIEK